MNIRKKPVRRLKSGIEGHVISPGEIMDEFKEPDTWTIITALDRILDMAQDSQLSDEFWESVKNPLAFLNKELGLTNVQIVALAMLIEAGEPMSWKGMGNYLGCSRLSIMVYSEEIEELVAKRWAIRKGVREIGGCFEGLALVRGVITALRHNKPFVPEKIDGLTEQQFVDKLESHVDKNMNDRHIDFKDDEEWMLQLIKANPHLPLCHEVLMFDDIHVIREKSLFFNTSEQEQIDRLTSLLSTENLPSIQQRLEEQGMRKGFACLFYGAPGTGKTETVLQIARQTGRDLMQVDIAGLRDKWVGESEKNIKEVFARYRRLCQNSEVMPILFFNEADAIINKRTENVEHSVDKMDNAMQNIILQEIEDLDGILIATTNLTSNLDKAFERRFLYKVEFHKPDTDVKTKIWRSMLKDISADDARQLASHFDFSGGQIENIARKRTVDYILSGKFASLDEIEGYCRAELLGGKERKSIGFIS